MGTHTFHLNAEKRSPLTLNKGHNRRLRRQEQLPGVVYGHHLSASIPIVLSMPEVLKALSHEAFHSHLITLNIAGETMRVILKTYEAHPASKRRLLHIDFQQVHDAEPIHMYIPLHIEGRTACEALKNGSAQLNILSTSVHVRCLPRDLPEYLSLDITQAQLDDVFHLSAIALPAGVTLVDLMHDQDHAVVSLHAPKSVAIEEAPLEASSASTEATTDDDKGSANPSNESNT